MSLVAHKTLRSSIAYTDNFYIEQQGWSLRSAEIIVPWIIGLVSPRSVIDVGCGRGTWLSVFQRHGVEGILGIDGDWVQRDNLEIPSEHFMVMDLSHPDESPKLFDLVISLEVAEHLLPEAADRFVSYLTSLGPMILFSAAIPGQDGTNHLNEQWPDYWISLFNNRNFKCIDCVRAKFWNDEMVARFYVQNAFLFVKEDMLDHYPALLKEASRYSLGNNPIVHPKSYLLKVREVEQLSNPDNYSIREFLKVFPRLLKRAVLSRLRSGVTRFRGL